MKKLKLVYTHSINGNIFYVGCGSSVRPYTKDGRNKIWWQIVAENEGLFDVKIVNKYLSKHNALKAEMKLIEKLKPRANINHNSIYKQKKDSVIIKIPDKEKKQFSDKCWANRTTMSEAIREMIKAYRVKK